MIAVFDDVVIQLHEGPGNTYNRSFPAFFIGQYSGTPAVWALKDDGTATRALSSETVTVTMPDAIIPEKFLKSLYEGEIDFLWRGEQPKVVVSYNERRIDRNNEFGIIIVPNKITRENTTRMHTKNVQYPLTIYVVHPDSYEKCKEFFDYVLNIEEKNINLVNSNIYDWLEPKDDGSRIPTREAYKIRHDLVLHADVRETNIS
jgi:hypothetical protein